MRIRLPRSLRTAWLPLYVVLSMSWLFGPVLHHHNLRQLQLISGYEAFGQPYGWLFRICDIVAISVLAGAAARIMRKAAPVQLRLLLGVAALGIIDALCATSTISGGWYGLSTTIHNIESSVVVAVLLALTMYDGIRRKKMPSILFAAFQVACAVCALCMLDSSEALTVIQYIYQIVSITWLAWLVQSFAPPRILSYASERFWRRSFGLWTAITGIGIVAVSILPLHHHVSLLHGIGQNYSWVAHHGVIVGVSMLYLARQVFQGQRRAAGVIGGLLFMQMALYAIIQPVPLLLVCTMLAYAAVWYGAPAFRKNSLPRKISSRFTDVAVILTGVVLALGVAFAAVSLSGHRAYLQHTVQRAFGTSLVKDARSHLAARDTPLERSAMHLRRVSTTLLAVTIAALLWSLFRPARLQGEAADDEGALVQKLLAQHSHSSEDYFKVWPADKRYFFNVGRTGFIAYKVVGRTAFALADPVCARAARKALIRAFTNFCHTQGLSACFLLIDEGSKQLYEKPLMLVPIGSSAIIDIAAFQANTARTSWWRWQTNRAKKAGYQYELATPPHRNALIDEVAAVSQQWMSRHHHREQSFALGYFDADYLQACRLHLLRDEAGALLAFANQLPVLNHNSQATVDLIRFKPEARGAMPMLVMQLINQLHQEGGHTHFDLGFVPLAKVDTPLVNLARRLAANRFSAAGLEQFKGKFKPEWRPNYIAYDGDLIDAPVIVANLTKALKAPRHHPK